MKSNANQKSHINLDKCLEEMIGVHTDSMHIYEKDAKKSCKENKLSFI